MSSFEDKFKPRNLLVAILKFEYYAYLYEDPDNIESRCLNFVPGDYILILSVTFSEIENKDVFYFLTRHGAYYAFLSEECYIDLGTVVYKEKNEK